MILFFTLCVKHWQMRAINIVLKSRVCNLREVISSPWYSCFSQSVSGIRAHLFAFQPRFQQHISYHDFIVSVVAHACGMCGIPVRCLCCKAHECLWDLPCYVALQQDSPYPLNFAQSPKETGYFSNLLIIYCIHVLFYVQASFAVTIAFRWAVLDRKFLL